MVWLFPMTNHRLVPVRSGVEFRLRAKNRFTHVTHYRAIRRASLHSHTRITLHIARGVVTNPGPLAGVPRSLCVYDFS